MIRYRTETAYGEGYRDAAEVMAFELFELGNVDILETLVNGVLKDNPICSKLQKTIDIIQCKYNDVIENDKNLIIKGIENGTVSFISNPNDACIACKIGEHWFYFAGIEYENFTPDELLKTFTKEELAEMVYDAFSNAIYEDEKNYYYTILHEMENPEELDLTEISLNERIEFFQEILGEIKKETGHNIQYALWLADKETVLDENEGYGQHIESEADIDAYEVGPVVLSDIGYDGVLYGYEEMPIKINEKEACKQVCR